MTACPRQKGLELHTECNEKEGCGALPTVRLLNPYVSTTPLLTYDSNPPMIEAPNPQFSKARTRMLNKVGSLTDPTHKLRIPCLAGFVKQVRLGMVLTSGG